MGAVILPIVGLLIMITLIIMFETKENVVSKETKIYRVFLYITTVFIIVGLITFFVAKQTNDLYFVKILQKVYMSLLVVLNYLSINYCLTLFTDQKKIEKLKWPLIISEIVFILLILILPLYVIFDHNILDGEGASYNVTLINTIISFIFFVGITFYLFKTKQSIKKVIPFITLIFLYIVSFFLRIWFKDLIFEGFFYSYILLIMYHTIENPDVKMNQALEVAREQADKANRAKTEFLSSMSHEIRTPLNAIVGFSGEILEAKDLNEAQENATDIVNASETLLEIVNGILDISKIEAGKIEIVSSPYNAHETFEELAKLITPKMKEKGLEFTYSIAPDLPPALLGDHANLKKVVTNLLSNACKYTERGYVHYEVNCVNAKDVCKLVISVEDSGRGIKKENVDKLFTQFQRLEEDRNTTIEGTGLGLAITKQLTELMGGRVILHTVYGEGSKFTVVLNQRISTEQVLEKKKAKTTLELKDISILIVDDTPLNLKVAVKLLERYGANKIDTCNNGFECLDKVKSGTKYDFILLDDMMPKMSGTETLRQLKEIPDFKTPAIALTANAITGMREKYLADGFDGYLAKPIEKEQLVQVINQILGRSVTEEINTEEIKQQEPKSAEIVEEKTEDSNNEEKSKDSSIIPVEENIEEMLGEKLDRTFSEEEAKMNNNLDNSMETSTEPVVETLVAEEIKAVPPVEVAPIEDPFAEDDKAITPIAEGVYDRSYLEANGVDVEHGLEFLGDMQMYNDTIADFVSEVETKWADIVRYKEENNMPEYAILVHSLKSDCKYLGFMTLADIAYQHELKSKENDSAFVNDNFAKLEENYNKVLEVAKEYVNHNK